MTAEVVSGHALSFEGAAFDDDRRRVLWNTTAGEGHAICTCGEMSPVFPSAAKRKAWHRDHKDEVRWAA